MIYIGTTLKDGNAVYFDAYAAIRDERGISVSGTIGDGQYEGEVLVECGSRDEVTFADAWLGGYGFDEFLSRCDCDGLKFALLETVRDMPILTVRRDQPHAGGVHRTAGLVAEGGPKWKVVA